MTATVPPYVRPSRLDEARRDCTATRIFGEQLDGTGLATWARPNGGCFIALSLLDGCAREVVRLAAEAGIATTPAGATHPYGITVCVRRADYERLIAQQN
ncbi:hypothetical protein [Streptomyces sp. NEAU-YJ-81]|uniref:hypothetical protein n=1 Tax=Streptomyces sp. NEAU-YJ-81 TaxID=2820288 RepID=UPI001FB8CDC5|nr:hypothetical protein [Streptomyces sp. NEAU-YJ-81]